jgi:hypothetical protein
MITSRRQQFPSTTRDGTGGPTSQTSTLRTDVMKSGAEPVGGGVGDLGPAFTVENRVVCAAGKDCSGKMPRGGPDVITTAL